jgi:hypothetical protein
MPPLQPGEREEGHELALKPLDFLGEAPTKPLQRALTVSRQQMLRVAGKSPILALEHSSRVCRGSRLRGEEYGDRWRTRRKIST